MSGSENLHTIIPDYVEFIGDTRSEKEESAAKFLAWLRSAGGFLLAGEGIPTAEETAQTVDQLGATVVTNTTNLNLNIDQTTTNLTNITSNQTQMSNMMGDVSGIQDRVVGAYMKLRCQYNPPNFATAQPVFALSGTLSGEVSSEFTWYDVFSGRMGFAPSSAQFNGLYLVTVSGHITRGTATNSPVWRVFATEETLATDYGKEQNANGRYMITLSAGTNQFRYVTQFLIPLTSASRLSIWGSADTANGTFLTDQVITFIKVLDWDGGGA
jgi:hypothetical protein